jgi:hypothetical protein
MEVAALASPADLCKEALNGLGGGTPGGGVQPAAPWCEKVARRTANQLN